MTDSRTDRKKGTHDINEEARKRSEERFRRLVEASSQIIWIANAKGDIVEDSPSWRAFTGKAYEELSGWKWEATIHPDDRKHLSETWRKSIETATPCHVEFRQMNANGQYRNILGTAIPIFGKNGCVIEWIGMNQDITERKQVDELLAKSEERYKLAERATKIGIWDWNILTGDLTWSETIELLFGFRKGKFDATYEAFLRTVHPDDRQRVIDAVNACIEKGDDYQIEHRIVWPDGSVHWVLETGDVIRENGKAVRMVGVVQDITERKNVEEALKREKEFSENILRTMPDGLDIVDENLRIAYMNKTLEDAFGKDNIGRKCYEVYRDDGKQCENCPLKNPLNGRTEALEVSEIRGGKTFLVSHTATMLNGKRHILEIFNDITERKQMEEKMLNLSRAVEQSHASVIITDTEGAIQYANPHFAEITGYSMEEVIGQNPRILKSGKQPREVYKDMWDTIKSGRNWQGEFCNKKKNGELYWEQVSVSPIKDAKGNVIRFVAVKEDITGRKKIEENLNDMTEYLMEEKDILETVTQNTETHLAYLDTNFNFIMVNPTYAEGTGRSTGELIGKNYFDLFPDKENESIFRRVRDSGKPVEFHATQFFNANLSEHGMTYWDWTLAPIKDRTGKVKGLVLSLVDITHRKAIEDSLKNAYERLKKVDNLKSSILRDVSHELRHPISLINMATNFLANEVKKETPNRKKMDQYVDIMRRNSKMFDQKLASVVELSKLEAVETLSKEALNVAEIARGAIKTNQDSAREKGIEIRSDLDDTVIVSGNREMITSLVGNLLTNAIKYTDKGFIEMTCRREDKNAVISVKDTGIGVSKENLGKIFEPFFKEDLSSEGLGVGLAICKKVVELHNGEIKIFSARGKGSVFTVILPLA